MTFTARDDDFHFAEMGDDWWATETSWFSFCKPEDKLGGWLYTLARPNIATVAGGAWVWDDSAHLPWEVLYSANYSALELPAGARLSDGRLPTGVSIRVLEPGMRYALGYDDGERCRISLTFTGIMAPRALTRPGSPFGKAHHFDQIGRVSGLVRLGDREIAIDCLAMRDRSWGRRPEDRPRKSAYVTGIASERHAFLAVTRWTGGAEEVAYGFLLRDGRAEDLVAGHRSVERDPSHGWVSKIVMEGTDASGRQFRAVGNRLSGIVINRHTFIDSNGLMAWSIDGDAGYGEDQDMWPVHDWADSRRSR